MLKVNTQYSITKLTSQNVWYSPLKWRLFNSKIESLQFLFNLIFLFNEISLIYSMQLLLVIQCIVFYLFNLIFLIDLLKLFLFLIQCNLFVSWIQSFYLCSVMCFTYLKSGCHPSENFCQIKISPSFVRKNTIIFLFCV